MASSPAPLTTLLVILSAAAFAVIVPSCTADYVLYSVDTLYAEQSPQYGNYILKMQSDCNLVLYDNGQAVWSSGTYNQGYSCQLRMQSDGNLVIYDGNNRAVWASNTARDEGYYVLVLQHDRNVVIYGGAIWATASNSLGTASHVLIPGNSTKAPTLVVAGDGISMVTAK